MGRGKGFSCLRCGSCCRGRGGIRLTARGAAAAASLLGVPLGDFVRAYLEPAAPAKGAPGPGGGRRRPPSAGEILDSLGSFSVRSGPGPGDPCLLLGGGLCLIHAAKPPVCRDWPFLPMALRSEAAFSELRECCPGLSGLSYGDFRGSFRDQVPAVRGGPGGDPPGGPEGA
jgi:Fe-S-cluster containining protein